MLQTAARSRSLQGGLRDPATRGEITTARARIRTVALENRIPSKPRTRRAGLLGAVARGSRAVAGRRGSGGATERSFVGDSWNRCTGRPAPAREIRLRSTRPFDRRFRGGVVGVVGSGTRSRRARGSGPRLRRRVADDRTLTRFLPFRRRSTVRGHRAGHRRRSARRRRRTLHRGSRSVDHGAGRTRGRGGREPTGRTAREAAARRARARCGAAAESTSAATTTPAATAATARAGEAATTPSADRTAAASLWRRRGEEQDRSQGEPRCRRARVGELHVAILRAVRQARNRAAARESKLGARPILAEKRPFLGLDRNVSPMEVSAGDLRHGPAVQSPFATA